MREEAEAAARLYLWAVSTADEANRRLAARQAEADQAAEHLTERWRDAVVMRDRLAAVEDDPNLREQFTQAERIDLARLRSQLDALIGDGPNAEGTSG